MIGRNGERRSGISAQAARHDDDDDIYIYSNICRVSKVGDRSRGLHQDSLFKTCFTEV